METKSIELGELSLARTPTIFSTILGSCVSVCLYCPATGQGGIIHYALPNKAHAKNTTRGENNFGDLAIVNLVHSLLELSQVKATDLRAKIVGGARVLDSLQMTGSIGDLNVEVARSVLKSYNIPIVAEKVGGVQGMKVYFYSDTGRVRVSLLEKSKRIEDVFTKKKVFIIDDSKTMREILTKVITSDLLEVVGMATCAEEAMGPILKLRPDVITLDIHMPGMDGVSFLEKNLRTYKIPTVMITSVSINESELVMKALEIGAVDYIQKPSLSDMASLTESIREKLYVASEVKIQNKKLPFLSTKLTDINYSKKCEIKLIAIGSSTGGTEALKDVLCQLPANIPPILIVQHIPPIFSTAFAQRLDSLCQFEVKEASDGDLVLPGRVLIAPGGQQMELIKKGAAMAVKVYEGEKVNRHMPSVDVLFHSVAKQMGKEVLGIILTGMGNDGAQGLLSLKNNGAYTIGQDEQSSVVFGMPKAAFEIGAVREVCSLEKVAGKIIHILEK